MSQPPHPIHPAAADGYSRAAETYVRGRPDYPAALAPWLRNALRLESGTAVLDLGAGTGKFTPLLTATGASVTAVEPVAAMRAQLAVACPSVTVLAGTAADLSLADASFDAVVCAQSFHWFATRAALAEIHRVLKPCGRLGLVWNRRDARVGWVAELDRIVNAYEGDVPRYASGAWRAAFVGAGFGPLHETQFAHGHRGDAEDVIVSRVLSTSFIAALAAEQRAEVAARVREMIAAEPALRGQNEVDMPYRTSAFYTVRQAD